MDFSGLVAWLDSANTFFQAQWDFIDAGIYGFFKECLELFVKASIYAALQFKLFMLKIAYEVTQEILSETGIVGLVKSAWAMIPGDMQSMLAFFKVPEGLALIFTAIPTRFAMKFIPGA